MKKIVAILAIVLLCTVAAAGGVALAIGPSAMLAMIGLGSTEAAAEAQPEGKDYAEAGKEGKKGKDAKGKGGKGKDGKEEGEVKMPVMPFPEIIVNVTDTGPNGGQTSRFLKLNMLMVYDERIDGAERLVAREIYLRDSFQDFLRQLHVSDLSGSYGLAMLKTELLRRARAVGHTEAPREILIADMVVQ